MFYPFTGDMPRSQLTVEEAIDKIEEIRARRCSQQSFLVAITGIDGSGKGYVTQRLITALDQPAKKTVGINIDGWLNLPAVRFNHDNPGEHFYNHAIRFEEMFSRLILPLKNNRSVDLIADFAEETASGFRKHRYLYTDVDTVLIEGIYLLKKQFRHHFDMSFWIDCTDQTALERAIARSQEGLSPAETIDAYHHIYFAAQAIHFAKDHPRENADFIIQNDPRLSEQ